MNAGSSFRAKEIFGGLSSKFIPLCNMKKENKISVEEFAATQRNRRGQPMSASYIYRLIRQDIREVMVTEFIKLEYDYLQIKNLLKVK